MALELNGTTGVSLVQDGVVTAADLASTLDLTGKTVTLPSGTGGKILQVVNTTKTDSMAVSTTGLVDIMSASITPASTSSKILVFAKIMVGNSGAQNTSFALRLYRGSTLINAGNLSSNRTIGFSGSEEGISDNSFGQYQTYDYSTNYLDSPSTTASTTYKISVYLQQTNAFCVNQTAYDGDSSGYIRGTSNITLMEVSA